ncbi:MAG: hypothetical protein JOS17DRAFT_762232 [Linnemannia elongata]|nr:MAG: hypothetical protein JOS17DRAFT_762232 [Linnemannia elongata]
MLDVGGMVRALRRPSGGLDISKMLLLQLVLVQEGVGTSRNWAIIRGYRNRLGDHGRVASNLFFFILATTSLFLGGRAGREWGQGAVIVIVSDMAGFDDIGRGGIVTGRSIMVVALVVVDLVAADVLLQAAEDALWFPLSNSLCLIKGIHGNGMASGDGGVGARTVTGGRAYMVGLVVVIDTAAAARVDDQGEKTLNKGNTGEDGRAVQGLLVKLAEISQRLVVLPGRAVEDVVGVNPIAVLAAGTVSISLGGVATDRDGEHDALLVHTGRNHPGQNTRCKDHGPDEAKDSPEAICASTLGFGSFTTPSVVDVFTSVVVAGNAVSSFRDDDKEEEGSCYRDFGVEPPVENYLIMVAVKVEKVLVDAKDCQCEESNEDSDESDKSGQCHYRCSSCYVGGFVEVEKEDVRVVITIGRV